MSEIGDIFSRYREALDDSTQDYEAQRVRALEAMREFYPRVFRSFIKDFSWTRSREGTQWQTTLRYLRERFGEGGGGIPFVAIDGTCGQEVLSEMVVFYGASYAQTGSLYIDDRLGQLRYQRWSPSEDTSVVAYLPVPMSRLDTLEDEDWLFRSNDEERTTAAVIHTGLMQLAEIYLAYRSVRFEDRPPKILLLDHSISSVLLSCDVMHLVHPYRSNERTLGWIDARIDRWNRDFEPADALIAHAHPLNGALVVPSWRLNAIAESVIAQMTEFWQVGNPDERRSARALNLPEVLGPRGLNIPPDRRAAVVERFRRLTNEYGAFQIEGDQILPVERLKGGTRKTHRERWTDLRVLFEDICENIFRRRRIEALQLTYRSAQGARRQGSRWMDSEDLKFLIGLGLRLLIEVCWQRRILLLGIVKDSASRFFTRNFLSVLRAGAIVPIEQTREPAGSDRLVCEMVPLVDPVVSSPWATIEFDAIFMTLRALLDENGRPVIQGVRRDILVPSDGLILRSLIQIFLRRRPEKSSPLMGHALFLDRVADPYFDAGRRLEGPIRTLDSYVRPIFFRDASSDNQGQDIGVLVADLLTRNCFPEAIGQPDPLHRADLGAKALGRRINELVKGSIDRLRGNPLAWTFRQNRDT